MHEHAIYDIMLRNDVTTQSTFSPLHICSAGLSKPTKAQLLKELYCTVASEWIPIGTLLEISGGELNTIAEREHGDPRKCLMAMLSVWLHRANPPASWPDIADAVEFTGRPDIAQQIRQKYCEYCAACYYCTNNAEV